MYFPYFRGRMYELIALKELLVGGNLSDSIIPVVEPIKITSTFNSLLTEFNRNQVPIGIIYNPEVGDLSEVSDTIELLHNSLSSNKYVMPSILMNDYADSAISALENKNIRKNDMLVLLEKRDFVENYMELFKDAPPKYTLAPSERQMRRNIKKSKILFEDKFNKQEKNAEYLKDDDEFFSDDHLFYNKEGFIGFGDYSIIGNAYSDGGFAPRAVAIHIVYFDENKELRIHHFVSDSNLDISDVAGKFHEAVLKLKKWYSQQQSEKNLTSALQVLLNHAKNGTYPGLPTIKKLSIMHHLELIGNIL